MIVDRNNLRELFAEYYQVQNLAASIEIRIIDLDTMTRSKNLGITALERSIAALKKEKVKMEMQAADLQDKLQKIKNYKEKLSAEIIDAAFKNFIKGSEENGKC